MVGAGSNVFAVWSYCIAKNRCGFVELNPRLLAFIIGEKEPEIVKAIETLCQPDKGSRSHDEDGRRLVRDGEYQYRMVNWAKYDGMKNAVDQREYNRMKQREYRARKAAKDTLAASKAEKVPLMAGETKHLQDVKNGKVDEMTGAPMNPPPLPRVVGPGGITMANLGGQR